MASSPPDSPLSSLASDDESEVVSTPNRSSRPSIDTTDTLLPPSKRRRTGGGFSTFSANERAPSSVLEHESDLDISDDTEGSAPGSPSHDEYAMRADNVTTCQWEGCPVGDLGNSDDLIKHVQAEHISPKRARYTCEWGDCARKGTNHPSGYALKAHMRSHTKEKPFFCALPECDRSFTRSDALAKHMRTVHEPEPPRGGSTTTNANPIDPSTGQPKKGPKLRLLNGSGKKEAAARPADPNDPDYDPSPVADNIQYIPAHHPITGQPGFMITYPPDIHFSQFESEIPANQLMRLLRRQLHWAQQESEDLRLECEKLEQIRREEWVKKEVLLEGALEGELADAKSRGLIKDGLAEDMEKDLETAKGLKWSETPWWKREGANGVRRLAGGREALAEADGDAMSDEEDVDEELAKREKRANELVEKGPAGTEANSRAEDDDMMAVGALMGLSAG